MAEAQHLTLAYSSESSIEAELKRESTADIPTIAVQAILELVSRFVYFMPVPLCWWSSAFLFRSLRFLAFAMWCFCVSYSPAFHFSLVKTDQLPCDVCVHFTHTWGLQTRYCSFLCYFEGEDPICILQEQGHKLVNAPWLLGSFLSLSLVVFPSSLLL
jgi:hypothetical protein